MNSKVAIVVAMAKNRCIGKDNDLPWYIPEDLKRFKALTLGKPVVMGRKTFESIVARLGKPLPGRANIVLSRKGVDVEGVVSCISLDEAVQKAKEVAKHDGQDEIIIGGGAEIYKQALSLTDRIYLTVVGSDVDGDAWFPELGDEWQEVSSEDYNTEEGQHPAYSFKLLVRS